MGCWWQLAPDLAVEIVSPSNTQAELESRCRITWLLVHARCGSWIDPAMRKVTAYHPRTDIRLYGAADELADDDVVPGFQLQLAELFNVADR